MSDPLSVTASLIAVIQISGEIIELLKIIKDGSIERRSLRDELRTAVCLLEILRDRVEETTEDGSWQEAVIVLGKSDGPLQSYQHTLDILTTQLAPARGKLAALVQQLKWPFERREVDQLLSRLERHKSFFTLIIQNDLVSLTKIANTKLDTVSKSLESLCLTQSYIEKHTRSEADQKILRWICPLRFEARHADIVQKIQSGTGQWLLKSKQFQDWHEGSHQIMWCPGIPGSGKTFIASIVINFLQQKHEFQDQVVAFVYCDHKARVEQTPTNIVASVLSQLLWHEDRLPQDLVLLYEKNLRNRTTPSKKEYLSILRRVVRAYQSFFVVIDAVDELLENDFVALVSELTSIGSNLRLFCTSRPSITIARLFQNDLRVEISAHDNDIRMYLEERISQAPRLARITKTDLTLRAEIIENVVPKTRGMFLLASLHFKSLASKLSRKEIRAQLQQLPTTLDDMYFQAMTKMNDQSFEDVFLSERVLLWIVCSQRRLTVEELQHMYATYSLECDEFHLSDESLPDEDILVSVCQGLVSFDQHSRSMRLVHYTAQEFFERNYKDKILATKQELGRLCIRYLRLTNFNSGACTSDYLVEQRLKQYPFVEYASLYWASHAGCFQEHDDWKKVWDFFEDKAALQVASQIASKPKLLFGGWSQYFPRNAPLLSFVASLADSSQLLQKLLGIGHNIEGRGSYGQTAIITAAGLGHLPNVVALQKVGANIEAIDIAGSTALMQAAIGGHADVVSFLVKLAGSDVNHRSFSGVTAVMEGVRSGVIDVVRILIEAKANLSCELFDCTTPLSLAAKFRRRDIFDLLIISKATLPKTSAKRREVRGALKLGLTITRSTPDTDLTTEQILCARRMLNRLELSQKEVMSSSKHGIQASRCAMFGNGVQVLKRFKRLRRGKDESTKLAITADGLRGKAASTKGTLPAEVIHVAGLCFDENVVDLAFNIEAKNNLLDFVLARDKLTVAEARQIIKQLFSAVEYLHGKEDVHRRISPENVLILDDDLSIKLIHFQDLACVESEIFQPPTWDTASFTAPEIVQGDRHSLAVDIWSLGAILYFCLCGFPPFSEEYYSAHNPYSMAQQIQMGRFTYPSRSWDAIPDSALELIDGMLTVDIEQRFTVKQCRQHSWMT